MPIYDYGMLDTARRLLRNIVDTLRPQIEQGVPVVALEPSCVAVFRDELIDLFPNSEPYLTGQLTSRRCVICYNSHSACLS